MYRRDGSVLGYRESQRGWKLLSELRSQSWSASRGKGWTRRVRRLVAGFETRRAYGVLCIVACRAYQIPSSSSARARVERKGTLTSEVMGKRRIVEDEGLHRWIETERRATGDGNERGNGGRPFRSKRDAEEEPQESCGCESNEERSRRAEAGLVLSCT